MHVRALRGISATEQKPPPMRKYMHRGQSVGEKGLVPARWEIAVDIEALVWEQSLGLPLVVV